ncbi:MAG: sigma-70 family RNA polymerase sigma factor [Aureibaculum sp.]|nr:sigma-70 family RNA polymerase sigma factor [Aureibaculum sp.]
MLDNVCDEKMFSRIYNDYSKDLHDYLYYKYGNQFDINDKVQEAFLKLWENCKKVAFNDAKGFVFMVAKNMMLNEFKHQKIVLKYKEIKPKDFTNETPEFILEKEQFLQKYERALSTLTEEQRVVFLLNKVEGKKHKEIAEILNITKKVVEYRIYTAFSKIKDELKKFD